MKAVTTIKKIMDKKGLTLYCLSKQSGIKYELLRRSLQGKRKLSADEYLLIIDTIDKTGT